MKGNILPLTFAQIEESQLGPLSFIAGEKGLLNVAFMDLKQLKQEVHLKSGSPSLAGFETLTKLLVEVNEYLTGIRRGFTVDIDWSVISGFQLQVLKQTAEIPYGQVMSYAEMAKTLDSPGAARAVGAALAKNPMPIVIPCHRVIRSDCALSGYLGGGKVKAQLLSLEGHTIKNNKVVSL